MFEKYKRPKREEDKKPVEGTYKSLPATVLRTRESPREILEADFPKLAPLPIKGGWGYSQETACIIDKRDPSVDQRVPFNGVRYEYLFAEYRIYEELIVFRPRDDRYAGIEFKRIEQKTLGIEDRNYDVLKFQIGAFREGDFARLKAEYEGHNGVGDPDFDHSKHQALRASLLHVGAREFWFDITSFYE